MCDDVIRKKLIETVSVFFEDIGIHVENIESVDFVDELGMDSLMFITLIIELENAFGFQLEDELIHLENFKSLDDIYKNIYHHIR